MFQTHATRKSHKILCLNTLGFTVCFAAWMLNGVLVAFLVENQVFSWTPVEVGWLLGIPVLTGAVSRFPAGLLTDKYGGKWIYGGLLLFCAIPMYFLSYADDYFTYALMSFGFGLTGASFSIGIAYTSIWYPRNAQGTALGIFGAGNAGAAITTLCAPILLESLTDHGNNIENWRILPQIYAAVLAVMGVIFLMFTENKKPDHSAQSFSQILSPLKEIKVWRLGCYYFLVFGCFVALSQWLVPYYMNVFAVSLVTAGLLAAIFSLPSGLIRALGGWMSDHWGPRKVMYWVLSLSTFSCFFLITPPMQLQSPGAGVIAMQPGIVTSVAPNLVVVGTRHYPLIAARSDVYNTGDKPLSATKKNWHRPLVEKGDAVKKKQLLAKGITYISIPGSLPFTVVLILIIGIVWGTGQAAVYKYIPDYFPTQVGVVGGMVGVMGGLGGFITPIIFGYLLEVTGLWTSMWFFLMLFSLICLLWMHSIVMKMSKLPEGFEKPLLEEIGGESALDTAVNALYEKIVADESLQRYFRGVDVNRVRAHQKRFLTVALSKPGSIPDEMLDSLKAAHINMGINEHDFRTVARYLSEILTDLGASKQNVDTVIEVIGSLQGYIVSEPDAVS